MPRLSAIVAVGLCATLAPLSGCSLTSDHMSCTVSAEECHDFENVAVSLRTSIEGVCRGLGGSLSTSTMCKTEGRVGGCRDVTKNQTQTKWSYAPKTLADVQSRCNGTVLDGAGNPLDGADLAPAPVDGGMCSPQSPTVASVTFRNVGTRTITVWWVNFTCGEVLYHTLAPSESAVGQSTFAGHIWRFREGAAGPLVRGDYTVPDGSSTVDLN